MGRATVIGQFLHYGPNDFYPRPPWGGRLYPKQILDLDLAISIHALGGEGYDHLSRRLPGMYAISIHALRGEGDDKSPEP